MFVEHYIFKLFNVLVEAITCERGADSQFVFKIAIEIGRNPWRFQPWWFYCIHTAGSALLPPPEFFDEFLRGNDLLRVP